jgi:WD40 repeat protein
MCRCSFLVLVLSCFSAAALAQTKLDRYGDPLPEGALMRLGTVRLRHPGVGYVAFVPDGKRIVSAGDDWIVRFWDVATGRQLALLQPKEDHGALHAFRLSTDGARLAVAYGEAVIVWDVKSAKPISVARLVHPPSGRTRFAGLSADLKFLASTDEDRAIRLWDVATGEDLLILHSSGDYTFGKPVLSANGNLLASVDHDKTPIWDLDSGAKEPRLLLLEPGQRAAPVAFTADDKQLITAGTRSGEGKDARGRPLLFAEVALWDVATGKLRHVVNAEVPDVGYCSARLSRDGKRVLVGHVDKLRIWELATGKLLHTIDSYRHQRGAPPETGAMDLSPDGTMVVALNWDYTIHLWDVRTGKRLFEYPEAHTAAVYAVVVAPDNKTLATGDGFGSIRLWDLTSGKHLRELRLKDQRVCSLAFSADGKLLVAGGDARMPLGRFHGAMKIWEMPHGKLLHEQVFDRRVQQAAISRDGRRVAVAAWSDRGPRLGAIHVLETSTGKETRELPAPITEDYWLAFSEDGAQLTAIGRNTATDIWDLATGEKRKHFQLDESAFLNSLVFSRDLKTLVSGHSEPYVTVWDLAAQRELARFETACENSHVALSPTGRLIAVSGSVREPQPRGLVYLLDARSGRPVLKRPTDGTFAGMLAFSPDGKLLVHETGQATAVVWDIREAYKGLEKGR